MTDNQLQPISALPQRAERPTNDGAPFATDGEPTLSPVANGRDENIRPAATADAGQHMEFPPHASTAPNEPPRPGASETGGPPRPDVPETPEIGRTAATEPDGEARPGVTEPAPKSGGEEETFDLMPTDVDLLTVQETVALLSERGLPRHIRTVQKLCHRRSLKCYRTPTENGVRYMIDRASVERMIEASAQQAPTGIETPEHIAEQPSNIAQNASQRPQEHAHASEHVATVDDRVTAVLERENDFLRDQVAVKDKQLSDANARLSEANVLNQNLQDTVLQLTGNDRPRVLKSAHRGDASHETA